MERSRKDGEEVPEISQRTRIELAADILAHAAVEVADRTIAAEAGCEDSSSNKLAAIDCLADEKYVSS